MRLSTRGSKKVKRGREKKVARVLGGERKRRTGSRPWPDLHTVPDPFLGLKTRLPDWDPARQSLHRSVHMDPDPDPSFRLFSGIRVPVVAKQTSFLLSVIFSIVVWIVLIIILSSIDSQVLIN